MGRASHSPKVGPVPRVELLEIREQCCWDSAAETRSPGAGRLGTFAGQHLLHVLRQQRSNAEEQEEISTIPRLSWGSVRALSSKA